MAKKQTKPKDSPESRPPADLFDWPPYWFTRLWRGSSEGDFRKAAEAQEQLQRLGFEVKFRAPQAVSTEVAP